MIDPETITLLAERLVAFLNEPPLDAQEVEKEFTDPGPRPSPEMARLFARSKRDEKPLPFTRRALQHYQRLRDEVRRLLKVNGVARRDRVEGFLNHHLTQMDKHNPMTPVIGLIDLGDDGQLRLKNPIFRSVDDTVAVLLAELESAACPVAIQRCRTPTCDRFVLRQRGSRGRPQLDCDECRRARKHRKGPRP